MRGGAGGPLTKLTPHLRGCTLRPWVAIRGADALEAYGLVELPEVAYGSAPFPHGGQLDHAVPPGFNEHVLFNLGAIMDCVVPRTRSLLTVATLFAGFTYANLTAFEPDRFVGETTEAEAARAFFYTSVVATMLFVSATVICFLTEFCLLENRIWTRHDMWLTGVTLYSLSKSLTALGLGTLGLATVQLFVAQLPPRHHVAGSLCNPRRVHTDSCIHARARVRVHGRSALENPPGEKVPPPVPPGPLVQAPHSVCPARRCCQGVVNKEKKFIIFL